MYSAEMLTSYLPPMNTLRNERSLYRAYGTSSPKKISQTKRSYLSLAADHASDSNVARPSLQAIRFVMHLFINFDFQSPLLIHINYLILLVYRIKAFFLFFFFFFFFYIFSCGHCKIIARNRRSRIIS